MAWTYSLNTTLPPGTGESPTLGDDRIRQLKEAFRERLNVDHDFTLTGSTVDVGANANEDDVGKHRKVTFNVVQSSPTLDTYDVGMLYLSDITYAKGDRAELYWQSQDGYNRQLTVLDDAETAAVLHLVLADLVAARDAYDAGAGDAARRLCDEATLEIDATAGLRVKAAGIGSSHLAAAAVLAANLGTGTAQILFGTFTANAGSGDNAVVVATGHATDIVLMQNTTSGQLWLAYPGLASPSGAYFAGGGGAVTASAVQQDADGFTILSGKGAGAGQFNQGSSTINYISVDLK